MAAIILNEDSGKPIPLEPEIPIDVGRGPRFDIDDRHLGSNPSLLHEKNLPQNKEVEVHNGDTVYLLAHKYPFKVILPNDDETKTASVEPQGDKYYYDDTNQDEYQTQKPSLSQIQRDSEVSGTDTEKEEEEEIEDEDRKNRMDENEEFIDDGWLSSESSLLGGESWGDEDDK
ncbi:hypothetical protein BX666DRAFT_2030734 [Dichotomocladium elegans]|nr:hypothetical protein BX666DRAFT_2030734 [Dichotomocladium elegans]